jgi:hypothetical protein
VLLVAGSALVLGAFLPWLEATTILGTISRSGVSYGSDALVTAGIGVGLAAIGGALLAGRAVPTWLRIVAIVAIVAAIIAGLILSYDYSQVQERVDSVDESDVASAAVGFGLWLSVGGAAAGIVGAILSRRSPSPRRPTGSTPLPPPPPVAVLPPPPP